MTPTTSPPDELEAAWTPPKRKYPTVHSIKNATGARAAVLLRYPTANPRRTDDVGTLFGRPCPIYAIIAGKTELGRGNGTSDAWEQTACALYSPNARGTAAATKPQPNTQDEQ